MTIEDLAQIIVVILLYNFIIDLFLVFYLFDVIIYNRKKHLEKKIRFYSITFKNKSKNAELIKILKSILHSTNKFLIPVLRNILKICHVRCQLLLFFFGRPFGERQLTEAKLYE